MVAPLDGLIQVSCGVVGVLALQRLGFPARQVLDSLNRLEVDFNPDVLVPLVVPHKCVAAVPVHVPV